MRRHTISCHYSRQFIGPVNSLFIRTNDKRKCYSRTTHGWRWWMATQDDTQRRRVMTTNNDDSDQSRWTATTTVDNIDNQRSRTQLTQVHSWRTRNRKRDAWIQFTTNLFTPETAAIMRRQQKQTLADERRRKQEAEAVSSLPYIPMAHVSATAIRLL